MGDAKFKSRLARLRREAEPQPTRAPSDPLERARRGDLPSWFAKSRGRRMQQPAPQAHAAHLRTGEPQGTLPARGRAPAGADAFAERVEHFAIDTRHGDLQLGDALGLDATVLALLAKDAQLEALDPRRALYLDIETTGLSGGAGTYPFLVALGRFDGERFEMWQGFMRHPGEERALLAEVAQRVRAAGAIVSFFGKAFDRHRLEDKMRFHGVPAPFDSVLHLDLYHPFRRLYGGALPDGKLQTLERSILAFQREDDLSGAFAPAAWFDYQASRPHLLDEVFRHNLLDVLSLAALTGHLGCALDERDPRGCQLRGPALRRALGIARVFGERRRRDRQLEWLERAAERVATKSGEIAQREIAQREIEVERAHALRLSGARDAAAKIYARLGRECDDPVAARASFELGRLLDRRGAARDSDGARAAFERCAWLLPRCVVGAERGRLERDVQARLTRLGTIE